MRKMCFAFFATWALFFVPAQAEVVKGVVVYDAGCNSRMVIYTSVGYILAEWYGGNTPEKDQVLVGDLNSYGFKDIWNLTRDAASRIYIDDYMLSRDRVIEMLREKCG